jgi:hypothetical protein
MPRRAGVPRFRGRRRAGTSPGCLQVRQPLSPAAGHVAQPHRRSGTQAAGGMRRDGTSIGDRIARAGTAGVDQPARGLCCPSRGVSAGAGSGGKTDRRIELGRQLSGAPPHPAGRTAGFPAADRRARLAGLRKSRCACSSTTWVTTPNDRWTPCATHTTRRYSACWCAIWRASFRWNACPITCPRWPTRCCASRSTCAGASSTGATAKSRALPSSVTASWAERSWVMRRIWM